MTAARSARSLEIHDVYLGRTFLLRPLENRVNGGVIFF